MMVSGLALAGLSVIVGYKALHLQPVPATSAHPVPAAAVSNLALATAARDIAVGETISASLVRNAVGDANRNPSAATPAEAIGKVATHAIPAGALIQRTMIDDRTKLAIRVPVGMRAMSIDTTAEIAVAGLIRPGDCVDVEAVYPGEDAINGARGTGRSHAQTLLQMVPVLAVGELVLGTNAAKTGNTTNNNALTPAARTVTLALTPAQVSTLSLAKHVGALSLSLRNPDDKDLGAVAATANAPTASAARHFASRRMPRRVRAKAGSPVQIVIGGPSDAAR